MTDPRLDQIREEIVLHKAAKQMGVTTTILEREFLAAGFSIMGKGKSRKAFVDDLVAFQARREGESRTAQQDELTKDYLQGKADAGTIPFVEVGPSARFHRFDLEEVLEALRRDTVRPVAVGEEGAVQ